VAGADRATLYLVRAIYLRLQWVPAVEEREDVRAGRSEGDLDGAPLTTRLRNVVPDTIRYQESSQDAELPPSRV
jgi:hypothetical protein